MQPDNPITIVIPVYNREATLARTLGSIDAQTVAPAAIVLVDNGSADASLSILQQWASTRPGVTVAVEPRPGACAARNRGLAMVRTPFVMFFDSDDVMLPRHVEDFTRAITEHPGVDIFGRDILAENADGSRRRNYFSARWPMFSHLFRASLGTARMVARTGLVRRVGGWDENLLGWDDFELGVRMLLTSPRLHDLGGKPTVLTYATPGSLTGRSFTAHPERWEPSLEAIRRDMERTGRPDLLKWVDGVSMILAAQYAREGSETLSARLYDAVMARTRHPRRMALIYRHNRLFGRLTWPLVRVMFPFG